MTCSDCPRLVRFRRQNRLRFPDWHNAPVAALGPESATLLVVGLAPGLKGANRTGRPFTGDASGEWLWRTLARLGLADRKRNLTDAAITNAVKCVPPANRPLGEEVRRCRRHLIDDLERHPQAKVIVALGRIAHQAVLSALGERAAFRHGAVHRLKERLLVDCYHPSPLVTRTGRMDRRSWERVWKRAEQLRRDSSWVVYLARCGDGTIYTGITNDLARRLEKHQSGRGAKYVRGRGPLTVLRVERAPSKGAALSREREIKALSREGKLRLIGAAAAPVPPPPAPAGPGPSPPAPSAGPRPAAPP